MGCYIDHFVRVEVESDNGIVALGMCGLFFDAEAVAFTVELPVGFLERDSAIFKHKLDIALAALSVLPLHSALGHSTNSLPSMVSMSFPFANRPSETILSVWFWRIF